MDISIHFESGIPRRAVALHAWEPRGDVWDKMAHFAGPALSFTFRLEGTVADQRNVRFKLRFPDEHRWESDDYVRTIPTRRVREFWAFDFSPRVMTKDPMAGEVPREINVQLMTRGRFAGGRLYAWLPGTGQSAWISESAHVPGSDTSEFRVAVEAWMKRGFHFKFVDRNGVFEPESSNRVWRPADGDSISVKSGQASLWIGALAPKKVTLGLLYPKSLGAAPELNVADLSGDSFEQTVRAVALPLPWSTDPRFSRADYVVNVFPEAVYSIGARDPALEGGITRPLRIAPEDEGKALEKLAVLGDARWLSEIPEEAPLRLVFHTRPWTPELKSLSFDLGIGEGPPFERIAATRAGDGTWRAETRAWVGVSLHATPSADRPLDHRADGAVSARRSFALRSAQPLELHTADAQPGFVVRHEDIASLAPA